MNNYETSTLIDKAYFDFFNKKEDFMIISKSKYYESIVHYLFENHYQLVYDIIFLRHIQNNDEYFSNMYQEMCKKFVDFNMFVITPLENEYKVSYSESSLENKKRYESIVYNIVMWLLPISDSSKIFKYKNSVRKTLVIIKIFLITNKEKIPSNFSKDSLKTYKTSLIDSANVLNCENTVKKFTVFLLTNKKLYLLEKYSFLQEKFSTGIFLKNVVTFKQIIQNLGCYFMVNDDLSKVIEIKNTLKIKDNDFIDFNPLHTTYYILTETISFIKQIAIPKSSNLNIERRSAKQYTYSHENQTHDYLNEKINDINFLTKVEIVMYKNKIKHLKNCLKIAFGINIYVAFLYLNANKPYT